MKKFFMQILFFAFICTSIFAEKYQICDYEINIDKKGSKLMGVTRKNSVLRNFPIDRKTVFESNEEFENYIKNYKQNLINSRAFETVEVLYETMIVQNSIELSSEFNEEIKKIILKINLLDSSHFLLMPYGKYSSNTGLTIKLKSKDTNFFGSLNTMNAEANFRFKDNQLEPGFAFSFDLPFKIGQFDFSWINDYSISYTIGKDMPEWNAKTGLQMTLPFEKISFVWGFYQYSHKNFDYQKYGDDLYFSEEFSFSTPIKLFTFENFTTLKYSPSILFSFNWDFDGIKPENDSLSSPSVSISHSLENSKINWNNDFRDGYKFSLSNSFSYNFQRLDFSPSVSFKSQYFKSLKLYERNYFDRFGFNVNFTSFYYFDIPSNKYYYGEKIGDYLRGILDDNFFGNIAPEYSTSSAIILNVELPHHIFTTNFSKQLFNFDVQISPFFDMALVKNRVNDSLFSFEDGYYCAGVEVLVFPLKWSSYTIRASLGINIKDAFREDSKFLKALWHNKEIFIGLGTQF